MNLAQTYLHFPDEQYDDKIITCQVTTDDEYSIIFFTDASIIFKINPTGVVYIADDILILVAQIIITDNTDAIDALTSFTEQFINKKVH
jgi:hypothetical protein